MARNRSARIRRERGHRGATFGTSIVSAPDGSVHDRYDYPLVAFRELIANALIHRDLDAWSTGLAIEVRLRRDRLVIDNPGGLYGITVDRLGRESVTSARNARLVAICQHVHSAETGARAIEALASGIPIVTEALAEAGLPPAHYIDTGIRFIVLLHQQVPRAVTMLLCLVKCLVKVCFGWHGWSLSGAGRELLSTGLLGADKTGRGRSGVEGRLL
jgi:hypothetical protein